MAVGLGLEILIPVLINKYQYKLPKTVSKGANKVVEVLVLKSIGKTNVKQLAPKLVLPVKMGTTNKRQQWHSYKYKRTNT